MYKIKPIDNQKVWQSFIEEVGDKTFLHSQAWADFNRTFKKEKVWQFGLFEEKTEELISVILIIKIQAKRGKFLLVPHGPQYKTINLTDNQKISKNQEIIEIWKNYLKDLAQKEDCSFFRIQPILAKNQESQNVFKNLGFRSSPIHMHTEYTTILDISSDLNLVLKNMRKTTRQMIKKAEKMVISKQIELEFPQKITEEMHLVYEQTYKRGGAVAYSRNFIDKEWEIFSKPSVTTQKPQAKIFAVNYEGKLLSWAMILLCGKRAFYHQGANILHKKVPAAYLCQWQGINFAKENGCLSYDFWGVSRPDQPNHPWKNISLFKRGFGGLDSELLHAQDMVLNWKYWPNWLIETYRAKKRGF
jgi:peptidoglycan pentaglycine glycine transferase (the first glycine)